MRVENFRLKDRIPTKAQDWFNWGGIYRDINLLFLSKYRIQRLGVKTTIQTEKKALIDVKFGITISESYLKDSTNLNHCIRWELHHLGVINYKNEKITKSIPILINSGDFAFSHYEKMNSFSFSVDNIDLWSPQRPALYRLTLYLRGANSQYSVRFGIREVKISKNILLLNNKPIQLKGINLHEELIPYGRAIPLEKRRIDILNIKKLGFNALRTGHYPHDESLYDICDKEGLLVLEEIPVYWKIDFSNPKVLCQALRNFKKMILRDYNHPSIIM